MADLRTMAMMPPDEQTSVDLSQQVASDNPLMGLVGNKLLLQYLSAAGQDIQAGRPLGANVNQVTQQNIAAQNYAKLLKKMLESGGDVKVNKDKVTINYPTNAADGSLNPLGSSGQAGTPGLASGDRGSSGENLRQLNAPSTATATLGGNLVAPNPSSSPLDIPASDLAGLTPQDISAALGFKMKAEELGQQKIMDVAKNIIAERRLEIEQAKLGEEKQTAGMREYQYALSQGYKGSFVNFKNESSSPEKLKLYELARADGYTGSFVEFLSDYAKMTKPETNITLGDRIEQREAFADVDTRKYFSNPTGLVKDLQTFRSSNAYRQNVLSSDDPKAAATSDVEFIEGKIKAAGGTVTKVEWADKDRTSMTWTVRFPNGKVERLTYGIGNRSD